MNLEQILANAGEEVLAEVIHKLIQMSFLKGETPEQAVEMIELVTKVFETARALGKAEASVEIFELISEQ